MTRSRYDRVRGLLLSGGGRRYRFEQFTSAVFSEGVDDVERITTLPSDLRRAIAAEIGGSVVALTADAVHRDGQATKVRFRQRGHRVGRVAFMGMGEPLANPHVIDAIDTLVDPALFAYGPRRITVSTVGMLPGLDRLVTTHPRVGVTFSLHAADGDVRRRLVPLHDRYPTEDVLARLDRHILQTGHQVTVACALIAGVNDRGRDADALVALLRGRRGYHVNLYPFNPSPQVDATLWPSVRVRAMRDHLRAAGLRVSVRAQFGRSIAAGCGQLVARGGGAATAKGGVRAAARTPAP